MASTLNALLSRNIPRVLANNLVFAKKTLGKLAKMDDAELKKLGLEGAHIKAIRDGRPSIPAATLHKVLEDSWRVCCVCAKRDRDIVIHHIKEWGQGGTHAESNLAVLCLIDHHRAHLSGGHAKAALTATDIKNAKEKWISRAKGLRDAYHKSLLNYDHRLGRWLWIHLDHLRMRTQDQPPAPPMDDHTRFLMDNGFIDQDGKITAETQWKEELIKDRKHYAFDSSNGQKMAVYVSDVLGRLLQSLQVMDITDMLHEKDLLNSYIKEGMLVFFRSQIEIERDPSALNQDSELLKANVNTSEVKLIFAFDLWTSLSMTSRGTHLPMQAERSVVAEVVTITEVGQKTYVSLTPLGISPDFLLHDPSQGGWVKGADNTGFRKRRKRAKIE